MYVEVLIETYWNVNTRVQELLDASIAVLIETYWNVNKAYRTRNITTIAVLIETYWNVNAMSRLMGWIMTTGINRNILECKLKIM